MRSLSQSAKVRKNIVFSQCLCKILHKLHKAVRLCNEVTPKQGYVKSVGTLFFTRQSAVNSSPERGGALKGRRGHKHPNNALKIVTPPSLRATSPFRGGVSYPQNLHRSRNLYRPQYAYSRTAVQIYFDCGTNFGTFQRLPRLGPNISKAHISKHLNNFHLFFRQKICFFSEM